MKITFLLMIFLASGICCLGQGREFRNVEDLSQWMMNYYKNPEPQFLLDAFKYSTSKKKIAKAGSRPMLLAFFSSGLRTDTVRQRQFFDHLKDTDEEDYIYGLGLVLWYIQSEHSINLMDEFLGQKRLAKYNEEFDTMRKQKIANIWTDSIKDPMHLDRLWADFFATGNEKSVRKIITKLTDINSTNYYDVVTAGSARWSLASNSVTHDKVYSICKEEIQTSSDDMKQVLTQILADAEKERQRRQ